MYSQFPNSSPYPYSFFDQTYLSQQYQMQKDVYEQQNEIAKLVKATKDFLDAARNIKPEFRQEALAACFAELDRQQKLEQQNRRIY